VSARANDEPRRSSPTWSPDAARKAHAERAAARALDALHRQAEAAWSGFRCPASAECCQLAQRGREPWLWRVEWEALRNAVPALPPPRSDGGCRFLDAEGRRCTVYSARPLGCRTYFCHRATGAAREPVEEMDHLQRRLEIIARSVRPDEPGPRPLTAWLEESEP
jgi:Fe-S-cluster containining protein